MIIGKDSPFRRIPLELHRKQNMFFDAIRETVVIIDVNYQRLSRNLFHMSVEHDPSVHGGYELGLYQTSTAFSDAWTVIDYTNRLRGLLDKLPVAKIKRFPPKRVFLEETADVKPLRNGFQHLNEHISKAPDVTMPVLGELSWFALADEEGRFGYSCVMPSGMLIPNRGYYPVNPAGATLNERVNLVTLRVEDKAVCLSDTVVAVTKLVRSFEEQLERHLNKHWSKDEPGTSFGTNVMAGIPFARVDESWLLLLPPEEKETYSHFPSIPPV